jgi:3'-5' exonuclease
LPRLELLEGKDFVFFSSIGPFEDFVMSSWDEYIEHADKHVGLDTEFDRHTQELYVISVSIWTLPVIVLHMVGLDGLPSQMKRLLEKEDFIFCGRQAGGDCNKIEQQHGVRVKHRLELGNLALRDRPELARVKGGTSLASLVESYLAVRCPIDKDIGQAADYSTKWLSSELQLYAAADAYCHRVVAIEVQKSLATKHVESSTGPRTIDNNVIVRLNFQGKVVAEGCVKFHGSSGRQMWWGSNTLGKHDCLVQITKVLCPNHIPSRRYTDKYSPEKEWPESATTLGHLWDSEEVPVLELE